MSRIRLTVSTIVALAIAVPALSQGQTYKYKSEITQFLTQHEIDLLQGQAESGHTHEDALESTGTSDTDSEG